MRHTRTPDKEGVTAVSNRSHSSRREVVSIFAKRADFDKAIKDLMAAGFKRSDLSVLASHDSIDAASPEAGTLRSRLIGLLGEVKYEGPLVTAGLIALAAGEVGAVIAAAIAAGVGGVALKELMEDITARPHSEEFARAVQAGSIVLWVDTPGAEDEEKAEAVLVACGGENVHLNVREVEQ
jgi:hypothetical protein